MLLASRESDCQFIWSAHAPAAQWAGLRDEIVDALRDRQDLPGLADDESAVVNYGREFFQIRRVNQGRSTQFAGASIPSMLSKKVCH